MTREYSSVAEQRCPTPRSMVRFLVLAPIFLSLGLSDVTPTAAGDVRVSRNPFNAHTYAKERKARRKRGQDYDRTWSPVPYGPTIIIPGGAVIVTPTR